MQDVPVDTSAQVGVGHRGKETGVRGQSARGEHSRIFLCHGNIPQAAENNVMAHSEYFIRWEMLRV